MIMNSDSSVLHSIPVMIEAALLNLAEINEQLSDVREQLKDAELEAFGQASDARTEDGTKALYTNDKARELAARRYLKEDGEYTRSKATERILESRKVAMEASIERLRRESRVALIDYEAQMLGHRAA
jgi:hypothetical protein